MNHSQNSTSLLPSFEATNAASTTRAMKRLTMVEPTDSVTLFCCWMP